MVMRKHSYSHSKLRQGDVPRPFRKSVRRQLGFTLVEILMASGLLILAMGLTVNFMSGFNKVSNKEALQAELENELRTLLNRIETEMMEVSRILPEDPVSTTIDTGKNILVASTPVINNLGMVVTSDTGQPLTNTLRLEVSNDPTASTLSSRTGVTLRPDRMLFTIDNQPETNRPDITQQSLARFLMPKAVSGNYDYPGITAPAVGTFTYYDKSGTALPPPFTMTTSADIAMVKVTLWGERSFGSSSVIAKKESQIRLRNWVDPTQPVNP